MAAVNLDGSVKHWIDGLPLLIAKKTGGGIGNLNYWFDGLPVLAQVGSNPASGKKGGGGGKGQPGARSLFGPSLVVSLDTITYYGQS